jgi:hypothetical protein
MKSKGSSNHHARVSCPIKDIHVNVETKQTQQFFGYGSTRNDFQVASSKNELMYRPTNKFNINDSIRTFDMAQASQSRGSTREKQSKASNVVEKLQLTNIFSDGGADSITTSSGRSNYSHAMEQNSLFQLRDNESIEQYIAQITKREKLNDDGNESSIKSQGIAAENISYLSTEQAMHYTIKCNNLAQWSIDSSSVKVKTLNFNIIQTILYRESTILRLKEVLGLLDRCYWKYCVHRIRESIHSQSLNSEILVLRRNQIFALQNEISVGIAHLRSLTISLTELVQNLRSSIDKELQMSVSISIFWKEINYMLKMVEDCCFIFEYSSCRYWFGFPPNCLMIPPKDHNPYEIWQGTTSELLNTFLVARHEKQQLKAASNKAVKGKKSNHIDLSKKNIVDSNSNCNLINPVQSQCDATVDSSLVNSAEVEISSNIATEWEQLRDYCALSWTKVEIEQWSDRFQKAVDQSSTSSVRFIQSSAANPGFWRNPDHNPLVVEAALGFPEVFPRIFLVPPLPNQLLLSCLRLQEVILSECNKKNELEGLQQMSIHNKEEYQNKQPFHLDYSNAAHFMNERAKLKLRQQGTNLSLQGLSIDHLSSCLDSTSSRVLEKSLQGSVNDHLSISNESDWHFFITSQEDKAQSLADENTRCGSTETFRTMSMQLVDPNAFKYFRLENCSIEYRKRIEDKINDLRRVIDRNTDGGRLIRSNRKGMREVSRLHQKWIFIHAVSIQKICRGYLSRLRVNSIRAQMKWRSAVVKLQTLFRGFLARRRFRKLQTEYKISTFLLRKGAVRRFRAAMIITKFVRKAIHNHRLVKDSINFEPATTDKSKFKARCKNEKSSISAGRPPFKAILSETDAGFGKSMGTSSSSSIEEEVSDADSEKFQSICSVDDGAFSISDLNFHDAEKRKFEMMQAKALVKRVNEGKFHHDSRRSSRLIPSKDLDTAFAKVQIKQFSKKQHSLFTVDNDLKSTVKNTNEVFLRPLDNKRCNEPQVGENDDYSSVSSKVSSRHSLPPINGGTVDSRCTSVSRLSFAEHLTLKEIKRRQKEMKETEQIRSVLHKFFNDSEEGKTL